MRLVGVLVAIVLSASTAYANRLPFEVVRVLPETNQVLVFDRALNTHVLLQPGSKFGDYTIIEVTGIGMIVEKQQERFTVYPKEAKFLALNVIPRDQAQPPAIFGKAAPVPVPAQVVDRGATDKKQVANELASLLAGSPTVATNDAPKHPARATTRSASTPVRSAKLKP